MVMLQLPVLLLNNTFEPLNIITVKRALRLIFTEKVEVLEHNGKPIRSAVSFVDLPLVIRMQYRISRPHYAVKFTKKSVFQRDQHRCQYCGLVGKEITIDHIVPKSQGGPTTWTNVVTACKTCNNKKGDRSLQDTKMKLMKVPREPKFLPYLRFTKPNHHEAWEKYLFS